MNLILYDNKNCKQMEAPTGVKVTITLTSRKIKVLLSDLWNLHNYAISGNHCQAPICTKLNKVFTSKQLHQVAVKNWHSESHLSPHHLEGPNWLLKCRLFMATSCSWLPVKIALNLVTMKTTDHTCKNLFHCTV